MRQLLWELLLWEGIYKCDKNMEFGSSCFWSSVVDFSGYQRVLGMT